MEIRLGVGGDSELGSQFGFFLRRDQWQWILCHRRKPKPCGLNAKPSKKGYTETQTYYPSLEVALTAVMDRVAGEANSLQEVLDTVRDFKRYVKGVAIK